MPWFRKHHACPCGTSWWDEWDCLCNDRCPTCDAEIEPDEHEAIQDAKSAKIRTLNDRFRKSLSGGRVVFGGSSPFTGIMLILPSGAISTRTSTLAFFALSWRVLRRFV